MPGSNEPSIWVKPSTLIRYQLPLEVTPGERTTAQTSMSTPGFVPAIRGGLITVSQSAEAADQVVVYKRLVDVRTPEQLSPFVSIHRADVVRRSMHSSVTTRFAGWQPPQQPQASESPERSTAALCPRHPGWSPPLAC